MVPISPSLSRSILLVFFSLICLGQRVQAQESQFTPFIGLGVGTMTFYGDVSDNNRNFSPLTSRPAFELKLSNRIHQHFDLSFEVVYGTIASNERSVLRNLNFQSEIRSGGVHMTYDFGHFLDEKRTVSPFLSLGVTGFEFLSKTDLFDAQGNRYYYWSDGTIRDLAQGNGSADEANELVRDYVYESDLREEDLDGIGDYKEISYAIPVGLGARFKLAEHFYCDLGTRMYFTGTDLIDNVTDESVGDRRGDAANDRFLYTSLTLNYGLHKRADKGEGSEGLDSEFLASVTDKADEDQDGVIDLVDQCPRTEQGVKVNKRGCPLDADGDGVPDYLDEEPDTAEGAFVNDRGETLTDDYFLEKHLAFTKGNEVSLVEGTVESASIPKPVFTARTGRKYMVQVDGSAEGITADLADQLLSLPDVQTIERGDTVLYMVGDYASLPEAVKRKLTLAEDGITGVVMESEEGDVAKVGKEATDLERTMGAVEEVGAPTVALWRIQVGAFKKEVSSNVFGALEDLIIIKGDDGLKRFYSGVYDDKQKAEEYRQILLKKGYNDAFLTLYEGGERRAVPSAIESRDDVETYDELFSRPTPDGFNESKIAYRILLEKSDGGIDVLRFNQYRELGDVEQNQTKGETYYLIRTFDSRAEALEELDDFRHAGLKEAQVVGQFNGKVLTLEEIDQMLEN